MKKQTYDFSSFSIFEYMEKLDKQKIEAINYKWGDDDYWRQLLLECESPIEQMLYLHLLIDQPEDMGISTQVNVYPMGEIRRLDFLISLTSSRGNLSRPLFVVETDGSMHNDEEKVMDDKVRDRLVLQDLGLMVIRFTGKEVYRDAESCSWEVKELYYSFKDNLTQSLFNIDPMNNPLTDKYQEAYKSYRNKLSKKSK